MKAKFARSSFSISGTIRIHDHEIMGWKDIEIKGLNQSKSGIYELVNKLNGKRYIGMARNLEVRYNRHMRDLIAFEHCNKRIQEDFEFAIQQNRDYVNPQDVFEFRVIIYCRPSELTFYEHLLIKYLNPEYNVHKQKEVDYQLDSALEDEEMFSDESKISW